MTPEKAIKTALTYEKNVHKTYLEAAAKAKDVAARKFFELMAEEEAGHVAYLESKLAAWTKSGKLDGDDVATAIPSTDRIAKGLARLKERFAKTPKDEAYGTEICSLRRALDAETETSEFYKRMVAELPEDAKPMFRRFLEIEEGHKAIVAAELDAVENNGFWFDVQEFNQELNR